MKSINYLQEAVILALASVSVLGSIYVYNNYIEPRRASAQRASPEADRPAAAFPVPVEVERKSPGEKPESPARQDSARTSPKGGSDAVAQKGEDSRIKALEQKISQLEGQLKAQPAAAAPARGPSAGRRDPVPIAANATNTSTATAAARPSDIVREKPSASKSPTGSGAMATGSVADDAVLEVVAQAERVIRGGSAYWPQVGLNAWNKLLAALDSTGRGSRVSAGVSRELVDVLDRLFDSGTQALQARADELSAPEREQLAASLARGRKYVGEAKVAKLQALARRQTSPEPVTAAGPSKASQAKSAN